MTKRRAKQIACAILAVEDLGSIVDGQLDANVHIAAMDLSPEDRERVVEAAHEIGQELFRRARGATDLITGEVPA